MARHMEAAAKPAFMSDHTRMQQLMEQTLSNVARLREQLLDAEATLRTVEDQVNQADADYKASLAVLRGSHKSEEQPLVTVGSFKLEDL
eukprot:5337423-Pyramimonas_sp.AAC.1